MLNKQSSSCVFTVPPASTHINTLSSHMLSHPQKNPDNTQTGNVQHSQQTQMRHPLPANHSNQTECESSTTTIA